MSTLSKKAIEARLQLDAGDPKSLVVTPILSMRQLGDVSIDLRLGNQFIIFHSHASGTINPYRIAEADLHQLQERRVVRYGQKFVLHPGHMVLGSTFEYVRMPHDLEGQVEGRSSWARFGLQIATATCIEPGFTGVITLELSNVGTIPVELYPGVRVTQLVLRQIEPDVQKPYQGDRKYRHSIGPEFSRLSTDGDSKHSVIIN